MTGVQIEQRDVSGCDFGTPAYRWLCPRCDRRGHWTVAEADAHKLGEKHVMKPHWNNAAVAQQDRAPAF